MAAIFERMIQNFTDAAHTEPHWGYSDRVVPCTNDPGSCAYLDAVYSAHDRGMLYMGILWASIGGILLIWAVGKKVASAKMSPGGLDAQRGGAASATTQR